MKNMRLKNSIKKTVNTLMMALVVTLTLFSKSVSAQESTAYEKAFKTKYPTVTAPMWIRKPDNTYEATFKLNGAFVSSDFTPEGKWLLSKSPIDSAKIPPRVMNGITKKFADAKITYVQKIETADKGDQYAITLKTGTKKTDALFDDMGTLLK